MSPDDINRIDKDDLPGYRRVAALLRQEILDGAIPAGGWLRLQAVAERCETSIQPVREALQLLEGEGLLEIHPNRGARVRGIDRQRLINIFEIREAVEPMMSRKFCEECSLSDLRRLEVIQARHDAACKARDRQATSQANQEFHHLINVVAGNEDARVLIESYYDLFRSLHRSLPVEEPDYDRVSHEHRQLVRAFHDRDCDAAAAISAKHIKGTIDVLIKSMAASSLASAEHS
jgi:DNA-binding GntR family transcriptional regulator